MLRTMHGYSSSPLDASSISSGETPNRPRASARTAPQRLRSRDRADRAAESTFEVDAGGNAYAAELDHWRFISRYFPPQTKRFWIPDAVFGGAGDVLSLTAVGNALVFGETLFVNTYLIGVTTFAAAGRSTFARYAAELAGVESEHRVLA